MSECKTIDGRTFDQTINLPVPNSAMLVAPRYCLVLSSFPMFLGCDGGGTASHGHFRNAHEVRDYLRAGGDPDLISKQDRPKSKSTLLHNAAIYGDAEIVRALLDGGANPNALDNGRRTPLTNVFTTRDRADADEDARIDIINTLLPRTDLKIEDYEGRTAFDCAKKYGSAREIMAFEKFFREEAGRGQETETKVKKQTAP
ncbi:MAG: ankyrin repeat domain-containing protein [Chthoniobacteraceae bacterium]